MIDVSVLIGASPRMVPAAAYGLAAATHELRTHGVGTALVAARTGATYRHEVGNELVLSAAGSVDGVRIYPVASLSPIQYLDWQAELERVLAAGAAAIRFFPEERGWTVESEAFRAMANAVRGRCPLIVPVTRFGDATTIGRATAHAHSPVLLLGAHYTQLGDCLAALARWPHLYLETSRLAHFRAIESVAGQVGSERLLFGSGAPGRPIQAALNAVVCAAIAPVEKRAILSGNASRIFGVPDDEFDMPIPTRVDGLIDVHGHIGALGLPTPMMQPTEQVQAAAERGIEQTIVSSLRAIADDAEAGNAEAFAATAKGDRLLAYVVVNPNDLEGACQSMDEAYAVDAAIGAKLHCQWSGQPTASQACVRLLREVAVRGRPLKVHVDGPNWAEALACVAADYPEWNVIVAHAGPGTPSVEAGELVERTSNVYVELSTSFADLAVVRDVVRRVGPGRLLFGTDAPLLDPAYALGIYADAGADLAATTGVARKVFNL